MKVALIHDYIKEYGGAERVLETLHSIWPDSDVYTLVYLPEFLGPHRSKFDGWKIKTSFLQYIPLRQKLISIFRLIEPLISRSRDMSDYDLVIVSSAGSYSGLNLFRRGKNTLHVCYYHTPPRYLYGYATANKWTTSWTRRFLLFLGQIPMHFLRMVDYTNAQKPDYLICNSSEVKKRIQKFYRRDAKIIFPPVGVPKLGRTPAAKDQRNYYLSGGRLARAKGVDLAVSACTKMNLPLKVFGKPFAGYGEELKNLAGSTIEFLGEVDDGEKLKLMTNAKAYIFPSRDEDFGITPVEAMAVGTPVLGLAEGGILETVIDGKTGILFRERTVDSLMAAIKRFNNSNINFKDCIRRAGGFSDERFKREFKDFILKHLSE